MLILQAGTDQVLTSSGVGIHHPNGSAKKISTFNSNLASSSYNGGLLMLIGKFIGMHTNGHGVTEGGSSGSPIFNQDKRIVDNYLVEDLYVLILIVLMNMESFQPVGLPTELEIST